MAMTPNMSRPRLRLLLAALLALATLAGHPATAQERTSTSISFTRSLNLMGSGSNTRSGAPSGARVDQDWRPYAQGIWVYTDEYGWYWVADEPLGWAVFHYGRWLLDEDGFGSGYRIPNGLRPGSPGAAAMTTWAGRPCHQTPTGVRAANSCSMPPFTAHRATTRFGASCARIS